MNLNLIAGIAIAIAAGSIALPASAVTADRKFKQNGAGACQGALPAFAGTLRARPLALQNEGDSTAFATCSPSYDDSNTTGASSFSVYFVNNTAAQQTVNCTFVNGTVYSGAEYSAKSGVLLANTTSTFLTWYPTDFPSNPPGILRPNVSCALPPGTGIQYVYYYYKVNVGA